MSSSDKPSPFTDESFREWFTKSVSNSCDDMLKNQPKPGAPAKPRGQPKAKQAPSFDMQMTRAVRQRASPASFSSFKSSASSAAIPVRRLDDAEASMTSYKKIRRIVSASDVKDDERIIQASDCIELVSGEPSFLVPLCIDCFLAKKRGDKSHQFDNTCRFGKNTYLRWVTMEPVDPLQKGSQRQLRVRGLVTEEERMKLDDIRDSHGPNFSQAECEATKSLFSNNRLDVEAIHYIVGCILPAFKAAVEEEKEALAAFASGSVPTALKNVPNGFRENCDVCETAIFDVHYVCQFCGFSLCLACKKEQEVRHQPSSGLRPKSHRKSFFQEEHFKSSFMEVPRDGHYWYACCSNPASPFPASDYALASTSSAYSIEGFPTDTFPHHFTPTLILPHKALEIFVTASEKMMERCGKVGSKSPSAPESSVPSARGKSGSAAVTNGPLPKSVAGNSLNSIGPLNGLKAIATKELVATVSKKPITLNGIRPQTATWLDKLLNQGLLEIDGVRNSVVSEALVIKTAAVGQQDWEEGAYVSSVPSPGQQLLHNGGVLWFEADDGPRVSPGGMQADQCDSPEALKDFRRHWKQGLPVVVSGVTDRLKRPQLWLPETFKQRFGPQKVFLLDCAMKPQKLYRHLTHQNFWDGFDNFDLRRAVGKKMPLWKIKDWPTETTFSELLPEHHADLMQALPFNSYTNTTGIYNLASYLPRRCNPPDLGPKMYIAYGAAGQAKLATTNLHLDISDAVNVIVHVGVPTGSGSAKALKDAERELKKLKLDKNMRERLAARETPGAVWQIYRPQDCDKIRDFIRLLWKERRTAAQRANDDPIHSQSEYLNHQLRQRLEKEYGVVGFDILQFEGDAIFIPAGAPHQVWNIHSCIKCAEDFVSPEHVDRCVALTREFRTLPKDFENKTDKLQVKNILFHTLKSMVSSMKEIDGKKTAARDKGSSRRKKWSG
ncbi:hypothetical protein RvY_12665 [Ramazzottius varieornatus]|uniref:JmjC domain-containing protein n=1 Tax=Ramazzottius varieornatus TaxID=947166 RepID=A0A1D1VK96_RAMVA|nr:hypothetical protein RvY_12665 [Ramazzottius varieornatus]